jgi:hypothetical protein
VMGRVAVVTEAAAVVKAALALVRIA